MEDLMSKNKFFKKLLVAGLCALTATATIGGAVACKKDDDNDPDPGIVTEDEYTVTWNLDGGKWPTGYTAPTKVENGSKITAPTSAQNPTKDGYTFVRWESSAVAGTAYNFDTVVEGDITLKAIWKKNDSEPPVTEEKYTVTIDLDGGSWEGQTVKDGKITLEVANDGSADLSELYAELSKLTKTDYVYDKLVVVGEDDGKYDWSAPIESDLNLKVVWKTPHKHEKADVWSKDASGHWYACKLVDDCDNPDAAFPETKAAHVDADGDNVCDECEYSGGVIPEKYTELINKTTGEGTSEKLLADTFFVTKSIAQYSEWGTAGIYQGPVTETNYIDLTNGKAHLVTPNANPATLLYADFGDSLGVIEGYFEISDVDGTNSYTSVQFWGNVSGEDKEIFGIRTNKGGVYKYRLNGGSEVAGDSACTTTWASGGKVYFKYDTQLNKITMTVDGNAFVTDLELTGTIRGIKFSSGSSNSATYSVDNLVVINTPLSLDEYKTATTAKVTAIETKMSTASVTTTEAKAAYDTAIAAATTSAECDAAYDAYYAAVLPLYKTAANTAVDTQFPSSDYTTEAVEGKHEGNKTAYTEAKTAYDTAITAATTLEDVDAAAEAFATAMQDVEKNDYYLKADIKITISDGTNEIGEGITKKEGDTVTIEELTAAVNLQAGQKVTFYESYSEGTYSTEITADITLSAAKTIYAKIEEKAVGEGHYVVHVKDGVADLSAGDALPEGSSVAYVNKDGNTTSANKTDFKFDGNAASVTITLKVTAGQTVTVKVSGFTGSGGNAVNVGCTATGATLTSDAGTDVVEFSSASTADAQESGIMVYTVDEGKDTVVLVFKRVIGKTTRVTEFDITVA